MITLNNLTSTEHLSFLSVHGNDIYLYHLIRIHIYMVSIKVNFMSVLSSYVINLLLLLLHGELNSEVDDETATVEYFNGGYAVSGHTHKIATIT